MDTSALIKRIHMYCPLCDRTHEVEERKHIATTIMKNETMSYEEVFLRCTNSGEDENEFYTVVMENENLLRARNAYHMKMDCSL